ETRPATCPRPCGTSPRLPRAWSCRRSWARACRAGSGSGHSGRRSLWSWLVVGSKGIGGTIQAGDAVGLRIEHGLHRRAVVAPREQHPVGGPVAAADLLLRG